MDEILTATCSNCSQKLSVRDPTKPRGAKIPLVLQCSHTICERCLMMAVRDKGLVTCANCKHESKTDVPLTTWSKWEDALVDSFPLNLYILGSFAAKFRQQLQSDTIVRLVPAGAPLNKPTKKIFPNHLPDSKPKNLCVECEQDASWTCKTCNELFCNLCFVKCHQFKSQKKHEKVPLVISAPKPVVTYNRKLDSKPRGCEKHGGQTLDFFCADCNLYCCSYCVAVCTTDHLSHTVRPMSEIAKELKLELLIAEAKAKALLGLLHKSQLALNYSSEPHEPGEDIRKPTSDPVIRQTGEAIVNHFAWLHAGLQRQEANLLAQLKAVQDEEATLANTTSEKLQEQVNDLSFLLQEADKAMKTSATVDMVMLTKRLNEFEDIPCNVAISDPEKRTRFMAQKTILYELENHCRLEVAPARNFTLTRNDTPLITPADIEMLSDLAMTDSSSDIPALESAACSSKATSVHWLPSKDGEPFTLPTVKATSSVKSGNSRSSRSSSVSENDVTRPSRSALTNLPVRGHIQARTSELVKVCHICNLSSFFILRVPDAKFLDDLSHRIQKSVSKHRKIPSEINQDALYLVEYGQDGRWYRARVRSKKSDTVQVVYVDYGNSEWVSQSKLRNLPKEFTNIQPMAIHCTIANIHPRQGKWSKEAIDWFVSVVDGITLLCRVFDVQEDVCHVDLGQVPGDDALNIPLSISDALLFLEYGQMVDSSPITFSLDDASTVAMPKSCYVKDKSFVKGQTLDAMVSHVVSPSNFYVHRMGESAKYLLSISDDLCATYFQPPSSTFPLSNKLIYSPTIGMACACQFTTDDKWYRAQVIGLPGLRRVEVQYVDYGNTEIVPYTHLRPLANRIRQIPALAIQCSLSDVVPTADEWLPSSRILLSDFSRDKVLQMFVNSIEGGEEQVLKVTLYEFKDDADICLNAMLVNEGLAMATGPSSSANCMTYRKPSTVLSEFGKQTMLKPIPRKGAKSAKKSFHQPSLIDEINLPEATAEPQDVKEPDPYKLEVKIVKALSPDSIYVAVKHEVPHLENMIDEMQEFYKDKEPVDKQWFPDALCVAKRASDQKWYRGLIMELSEENQAVVALRDIVEVELIAVSDLRELDPRFQTIQDGAFKCQLAGIIPAGGTTKWSNSACEFVEDFAKKHQKSTYVTKMGVIEGENFPVELYVCESYTPGPLDPTVERWFTLNNLLLEAGLALPIRGEQKAELTITSDIIEELKTSYDQHTRPEWMVSMPRTKCQPTEGTTFTPEGSSITGESCVESEQDILKCEEETMALKWLFPEPIEMTTFQASPTFVDNEGFIYLHDYISMPQIKDMQAALQAEFGGSVSRPQDLYWQPGQLCICQYHLDENWYRGQVIQYADEGKVIVAFVDYGNIETCNVDTQLRKCTFRPDVPRFAHKCYLYNTAPIGNKWTTPALDCLHGAIVDQRCNIISRSKPELGKTLLISVSRCDGIDISKWLVQENHAKFTKMEKIKVDVFNSSNEEHTVKSHEMLCTLTGHDLTILPPDDNVDPIKKVGQFLETSDLERELRTGDSISIKSLSTIGSESDEKNTSGHESDSNDIVEQNSSHVFSEVRSRRGPGYEQFRNDCGPNPLLEKTLDADLPKQPEASCASPDLQSSPHDHVEIKAWYDLAQMDEQLESNVNLAPGPSENTVGSSKDSSIDGSPGKDSNKSAVSLQPLAPAINSFSYHWEELPDNDEMEVTVLTVESPNKVMICCHDNEELESAKSIRFKTLMRTLQDEAPMQPQIHNPKPGMLCVACFTVDSLWYRALIVGVDKEELTVEVQYVDYANIETLPYDSVVEMKREWTEMPVQARECYLWHIVQPDHVTENEVLTNLEVALVQRRVLAVIKQRKPVLTAELLDMEGRDYAYGTLIEAQMLLSLE